MSKDSSIVTGRRGSRVTVQDSDGISHEMEPRDEVILMPPNTNNKPMASVGCSLTVGQSTQYAREKVEVSAWCTLPCEPTEEAIKAAQEAAYAFAEEEVAQRSDEAMMRFFPHLMGDDE